MNAKIPFSRKLWIAAVVAFLFYPAALVFWIWWSNTH